MAKVFIITEVEMNSLITSLHMEEMKRANHLVRKEEVLSPEENNRLASVHRAFHMVCIRWAQSMGFEKTGMF